MVRPGFQSWFWPFSFTDNGMAKEFSGSGSGYESMEEGEIDDMLRHLQLNDDELDEVVLDAEVVQGYKKEARWLAIGRILTTRSFSSTAFIEKMKSIWNLSRPPICREAGELVYFSDGTPRRLEESGASRPVDVPRLGSYDRGL